MKRLRSLLVFVLGFAAGSPALAHEAGVGESGFMHAVASADHLTGFVVIGAMSGLYVYLSGGRTLVFGSLLALVLLASHTHASVTGQTGVIFAMGFVGAGLMAAISASELAIALLEKTGLRRRDADKD